MSSTHLLQKFYLFWLSDAYEKLGKCAFSSSAVLKSHHSIKSQVLKEITKKYHFGKKKFFMANGKKRFSFKMQRSIQLIIIRIDLS